MANEAPGYDQNMISHYNNMIDDAVRSGNISVMISLYEQMDRMMPDAGLFPMMERQFANALAIKGGTSVAEYCHKENPEISDWYVFNSSLRGSPATICRILYFLDFKGAQNDANFQHIAQGTEGGQRGRLIGYLLEKGHQVTPNTLRCIALNATDPDGIEILKMTLPRVENVELQESGALQLTAGRGNTDTLRYLLENGADVNGMTAQSDWLDMRELRTAAALHFAVAWGHAATVKVLLEYGADIGMADGSGCTPIMLAREGGHSLARLPRSNPGLDHCAVLALLQMREAELSKLNESVDD